MFEVEKSILLVTTASALNNNLAIESVNKSGSSTSVAVIHGGWVNMIPVTKTYEVRDKYIPVVPANTRPKKVTSVISQVLWFTLGDEQLFATASSLGLHVFDSEGRILMYSHPCNTLEKDKSNGHFACSMAALDNKLFVGDSVGTIRVFKVYGDEGGVLLQEQKGHPCAVAAIASSARDRLIVSGDDIGLIVLWSFAEKLERIMAIDGYNSPCNSIHLWRGVIISGYSSGHIRCFSADNGHILFEIGAHARSITALDVSEEQGFLLSVSEDSFAKVWKINRRACQIEPISSECIQDSILVGGRFLNVSGTEFCVSTYDSTEVLCFTASKGRGDG